VTVTQKYRRLTSSDSAPKRQTQWRSLSETKMAKSQTYEVVRRGLGEI